MISNLSFIIRARICFIIVYYFFQIGYIEYELLRLSSLELRKKKSGLKYGSTNMLEQRTTLASLLHSLLSEKEEREDELSNYLLSLKDCRQNEKDKEDFWLIQYQRLLAMKPAGLIEAEEQLDPKVHAFLEFANAQDLTPVFARHKLTYEQLMEFNEEDFSNLGIGGATYHGLQRSLHQYLAKMKLEPSSPTAPSAEESDDLPSAPALEDEASAPPIEEQFVESECVICINASCNVVFLPCGHVCVCSECCATLSLCPMCRAEIAKKILSTN